MGKERKVVKPDDFRNGGKHGTAELSGTFFPLLSLLARLVGFGARLHNTRKGFHFHFGEKEAKHEEGSGLSHARMIINNLYHQLTLL